MEIFSKKASKFWNSLNVESQVYMAYKRSLVNKSVLCEFYQIGKGKCLPFSFSSIKSCITLEIVHSNLWHSPMASIMSISIMMVQIKHRFD